MQANTPLHVPFKVLMHKGQYQTLLYWVNIRFAKAVSAFMSMMLQAPSIANRASFRKYACRVQYIGSVPTVYTVLPFPG